MTKNNKSALFGHKKNENEGVAQKKEQISTIVKE